MLTCGAQRNSGVKKDSGLILLLRNTALFQTLRHHARWVPTQHYRSLHNCADVNKSLKMLPLPACWFSLTWQMVGWWGRPILVLSKQNLKVDLFFF